MYILITTQAFDKDLFKEALEKTIEHRGTKNQINDYNSTISIISKSVELQKLWSNYQFQFVYARDISYEEIIKKMLSLFEI